MGATRQLRSRTTVIIAVALVALAGIACSEEESAPEPAASPSAEPEASQITGGSEDSELVDAVLTPEEIAQAPGAPPSLMQQPLDASSFSENPDPRGPCGAPVEQPPFSEAAISAFAATQPPQANAFHAVWDLPEGVAETFLEKYGGDVKSNCPTFTSKTPAGEQDVKLLREIPLDDAGADAVATTSRITVGDAPPFFASGSFLRNGNRLSVFVIFAEEPVSARFIQGITGSIIEKL